MLEAQWPWLITCIYPLPFLLLYAINIWKIIGNIWQHGPPNCPQEVED